MQQQQQQQVCRSIAHRSLMMARRLATARTDAAMPQIEAETAHGIPYASKSIERDDPARRSEGEEPF